MTYTVFARKWRPQIFQEIVGQECIVTAICNSLSLGRIHHAWLFSGTRGIGKTTLARLLAKSLNCMKGITDSPCRKCMICQSIEKGLCLDFMEIDAASRTKVEDIKEILDNVHYAPAIGRFKIYLIDEVHMLSRHSFNAFLKILEEPPQHVKFILATTDIDRIPKTIISRCLCFNLKKISQKIIFNFLQYIAIQENIRSDAAALQIIASHSQGSMRDGLNLMEQTIALGNGHINLENITEILGIPTTEQVFLLTESILQKNTQKTIDLLKKMSESRIEWENVLIEILRFLHHISMIQSFPLSWKEDDIANYKNKIKKIACNTNHKNIQLCYQILSIGRKELPFSPSYKIGVEMILLRAIEKMECY